MKYLKSTFPPRSSKCLVYFPLPLHILVFYVIFLSSPYHPTSFHTNAFTLLDLNDLNLLPMLQSSLGHLGCHMCLVGYPILSSIKWRVGGMEAVTCCFWQLSLMNRIHGNLRTCSPEVTLLPNYICWKWAVSAETFLINDAEWLGSQPKYDYGNICKGCVTYKINFPNI